MDKPVDNKVLFKWVTVKDGIWVPRDNAVEGGLDKNGNKTFVGRAFVAPDLIPGKIIPSDNACYVSKGRQEYKISSPYQVLTTENNTKIAWVPSSDGAEPPTGAVQGGTDYSGGKPSGETLFIGRAMHTDGTYKLGKVHLSHNKFYAPVNGTELSFTKYEVLCVKTIAF